ncbi:DarT1-associated NADAR antitoxin family protein, partial [Ursidibacter sp. B-7004-1]
MTRKSIGKTTRPIFIPNTESIGVTEKNIEFDWHMGMSAEVRKRSIKSLHKQAEAAGFKKILEASSKSEQDIGIQLSAFFLKNIKGYPVENLFQSSKVFEKGGPYRDLLTVTPRDAKKDVRLKESGNLIKFSFNNKEYPLEPKSLFYDWLYLNVLFSERNLELRETFFEMGFDAFSDIEFNPNKSFSCQARTLALCVS